MSTEPPFEWYTKILKSFYLPMIKKHSNMLKLSRNFLQMMDEINVNENITGMGSKVRIKQDFSAEKKINQNYAKNVKSLRNLYSLKTPTINNIYENEDVKKIILFAYLHNLISISNIDLYNMIETKSKLLIDTIQQQQIQDKNKWQRCLKEWKKIMQLLNHKEKVRWEKILTNSINSLQNNFIDVILKSIINNSINLINLFSNIHQNIQQLATHLKISINFFLMNGQQLIKKIQHGNFKQQLNIVYNQNTNNYSVYDRPPFDKSEDSTSIITLNKIEDKNYLSIQNNLLKIDVIKSKGSQCSQSSQRSKIDEKNKSKEKSDKSISETSRKSAMPTNLIKKKSLRVIEALLREYNSNTNKLNDLECMAVEETTDTKIKKLIQSRIKDE